MIMNTRRHVSLRRLYRPMTCDHLPIAADLRRKFGMFYPVSLPVYHPTRH